MFRRTLPSSLRPTVGNTVGLTTRFSGSWEPQVACCFRYPHARDMWALRVGGDDGELRPWNLTETQTTGQRPRALSHTPVSLSHTHTLSHTHSSLSLSLSHTHTLTHTTICHTHTHTSLTHCPRDRPSSGRKLSTRKLSRTSRPPTPNHEPNPKPSTLNPQSANPKT